MNLIPDPSIVCISERFDETDIFPPHRLSLSCSFWCVVTNWSLISGLQRSPAQCAQSTPSAGEDTDLSQAAVSEHSTAIISRSRLFFYSIKVLCFVLPTSLGIKSLHLHNLICSTDRSRCFMRHFWGPACGGRDAAVSCCLSLLLGCCGVTSSVYRQMNMFHCSAVL